VNLVVSRRHRDALELIAAVFPLPLFALGNPSSLWISIAGPRHSADTTPSKLRLSQPNAFHQETPFRRPESFPSEPWPCLRRPPFEHWSCLAIRTASDKTANTHRTMSRSRPISSSRDRPSSTLRIWLSGFHHAKRTNRPRPIDTHYHHRSVLPDSATSQPSPWVAG
jgi:hypothetical protein